VNLAFRRRVIAITTMTGPQGACWSSRGRVLSHSRLPAPWLWPDYKAQETPLAHGQSPRADLELRLASPVRLEDGHSGQKPYHSYAAKLDEVDTGLMLAPRA
jgi:hypothetical protein